MNQALVEQEPRDRSALRRRDMTALLAEVALPSPMNSRSDKALAELVHNPKIIRVSADANDHDNHTIDKEVVDVNLSTAAWYCSSQPAKGFELPHSWK